MKTDRWVRSICRYAQTICFRWRLKSLVIVSVMTSSSAFGLLHEYDYGGELLRYLFGKFG